MKKFLHICLLFLHSIMNLQAMDTTEKMDTQKKTYVNFTKKELKYLIKKSGTGLIKEGDHIPFSWRFATKEHVRADQSWIARKLIKSIDTCMNSEKEEYNSKGNYPCAYAFKELEEIKNRTPFWFFLSYRVKKLYEISDLVKNKLDEFDQGLHFLGIDLKSSDLITRRDDYGGRKEKKMQCMKNRIRECLEGKEYGYSCREAKKLIWQFRDKANKSKEVSRRLKQAHVKIKEYKKNFSLAASKVEQN